MAYAHGNSETAKQDPQIFQVVGDVIAKIYGANIAMLGAAASAQRFFEKLIDNEASEAERARLEIEAYQAQVSVATRVLDATTALLGGLGASALSRARGLDRFWRNARAIASHNPLLYPSRQIGDFAVNGTAPPSLCSLPLPSADVDKLLQDVRTG